MTTICTVRKLDRDDAEAWALLRQEALEAHPLAFGATIPEDPKTLVESFLTRLTSNGESAVFGAFIDDSLIGIAGVRRNPGGKERQIGDRGDASYNAMRNAPARGRAGARESLGSLRAPR